MAETQMPPPQHPIPVTGYFYTQLSLGVEDMDPGNVFPLQSGLSTLATQW